MTQNVYYWFKRNWIKTFIKRYLNVYLTIFHQVGCSSLRSPRHLFQLSD